MDKRKPIIVGVGEILWDMLPGGKVLGGAPANFAYHCSQLGADTSVISAVGIDNSGTEILQCVKKLGLPGDFLFILKEHPTSTVTISLDAEGHPDYTIHENVAWDYIPTNPKALDLMSGADAVCFGSLAQRSTTSRYSILSYLDRTPDDCLRVFDINLRQNYYSRELLEASLEYANVLKLNDEELVILTGLFPLKGDENNQIKSLLEHFDLKLIALTRGSQGSTLFNGRERSDYRSEKIRVVDTIGAGDSFTAAMVMSYLKGRTLNEMNRLASNLAAFVCTQKGATPLIPAGILGEISG